MTGLVLAYVIAGSAFAIWFVCRGAASLDPAAGASGWGFRLIILPGAVALWPYLLLRITRKEP